MAPPTTSRLRGDGLELAVTTWEPAGSPAGVPTVVLVHGFPDTHAVWVPVAELLHERGFAVVAYDVRGAGSSDAPSDLAGYRLDRLVGDLAAVVDAVSPDAPVHLAGHDWGSIQGWEAIADPRLDGRIASFTSISGPPLDHAARWVRTSLRRGRLVTLARQATRSSYVAAFQVPGLAALARRGHRLLDAGRDRWAATLRSAEGADTDAAWPAPTFGRDVANGMELYRANFGSRLREGRPARPSPVPVQLVLPTQDRFVPAWLLEGIEEAAPDLRRVELEARHWVLRSAPAAVAGVIAAHAEAHQPPRRTGDQGAPS